MENNFEIKEKEDFCPVRDVLDRFGDKWSILVIIILGNGQKIRFNELQKMIGDISQKMLAVTLRKLEADGLIIREIFPEIPPRVEYQITLLGNTLLPHVLNLAGWAQANITAIRQSRKQFA